MVGHSSPTFLAKLNSTANDDFEKVLYGYAVIRTEGANRLGFQMRQLSEMMLDESGPVL
jgi:hypothetical protein